jgi:GTPase SAR1 family protein
MYSWDNAQVVLVGNKCDLEQDRAVTQERGQRLADQLGKFMYIYMLDVRFNCLF